MTTNRLQHNSFYYIRLVTVFGILLSLCFLYFFQSHPSLFSVNGSFQHFLQMLGPIGPIVFILFQMIQVIYPIIPGGMTCVIGLMLFGYQFGFVYNILGIFLGSVLSFKLARRYGAHFAKAFVKEETYQKYITYLDRKEGKSFEKFLLTAFILPGFPDDFLCMVAGLGKMSLRRFVLIFSLGKPVTLYFYTLFSLQGLNLLLHLLH